jgi:hypothetical protein
LRWGWLSEPAFVESPSRSERGRRGEPAAPFRPVQHCPKSPAAPRWALADSRTALRKQLCLAGLRCAAAAALAVLASSGCTRSSAHSDEAPAASRETAATYNAARGLALNPLARDFVGIETADFAAGVVPASAVLRTIEGTFVYVENGGWFLRTRVTLGPPAADGATFPVREGLYEGDRIVVRAVRSLWLAELHFLRAGQSCAQT